MTNSDKVTGILLGVAVGLALVKFFNMDEKEREKFYDAIKERIQLLLQNTDETAATVKQHFAEIDAKSSDQWIDKLLVFKRLLTTLFGIEGRLLPA